MICYTANAAPHTFSCNLLVTFNAGQTAGSLFHYWIGRKSYDLAPWIPSRWGHNRSALRAPKGTGYRPVGLFWLMGGQQRKKSSIFSRHRNLREFYLRSMLPWALMIQTAEYGGWTTASLTLLGLESLVRSDLLWNVRSHSTLCIAETPTQKLSVNAAYIDRCGQAC